MFSKLIKAIVAITLVVGIVSFNGNSASAAKVMWGKTELKLGQIGKITILSNTNLVKLDSNGSLATVRTMKKGEEYRVYSYKSNHGGLYGVGGGSFVQKNAKVKYETPSKSKLALLQQGSKKTKNDEVYFKNNEAKLIDLKIRITETKVIQPGETGNEYGDKPVFAIWYDTTNFSDKDIDPIIAWIAVFTVIQDNNPNAINELNMGPLPDESFLDSQTETIKKDGTVTNAVAYELDDLETPVTLIANQGIAGDELGRQDYEIK